MKLALEAMAITGLVWLASSTAVGAVAPTPLPSASTSSQPLAAPVKRDGPPSLFDEGQAVQQQQAFLDVVINVPHKTHPKDVFNIYPYPVKPPVAMPPAPLPVKEKEMKQLLLATGYQLRSNPTKPFQVGGWRWQYCLRAGINKSGLGVPHTIFSEYGWVRDVSPYVGAETKKWNDFEAQRTVRYGKALANFEKNHADAEAESVQQGLYPMELRKYGFGMVKQNIPVGTWWFTCTRKVPGLTYYWQVPMTAAPGEKIHLELTELNALVIEGSW